MDEWKRLSRAKLETKYDLGWWIRKVVYNTTFVSYWVVAKLRKLQGFFVDFPILNEELPRSTSYNIYIFEKRCRIPGNLPTLKIKMQITIACQNRPVNLWKPPRNAPLVRGYASSQRRADWESQVAQAATFAQLRFEFFFSISCGSFVVS